MNELLLLNYKLLTISTFKNILKDKAIVELLGVFAYSTKSLSECLIHFSNFLKILYESEFEGDFSNYLVDLIKHDENVFTKKIARGEKLSEEFISNTKVELEVLNELCSMSDEKIKNILSSQFSQSDEIISLLGKFSSSFKKVDFEELLNYLKVNSYGIFAKYSAFNYNKDNTFSPIKYPDTITFDDLKDYQVQQEKLILNTKALVNSNCANNVLLYGDRGCGKSSSVKAVFNKFKDEGLKIVQISKQNLANVDKLLEKLAKVPSKFIVFIDDLSFSQEDENLSLIKSALEGAISKRSDNVVIYATTNRRNIIKETFSSREGNEVHLADTIDENASLSDRFGLVLTFLAPNKDKFLEIAKKIAQDKNIQIADDFELEAQRFATQKASRSPRVAQQFVKKYVADK